MSTSHSIKMLVATAIIAMASGTSAIAGPLDIFAKSEGERIADKVNNAATSQAQCNYYARLFKYLMATAPIKKSAGGYFPYRDFPIILKTTFSINVEYPKRPDAVEARKIATDAMFAKACKPWIKNAFDIGTPACAIKDANGNTVPCF